jgi:sulfide:quinone oxidoreductase
MARVLVLGGGFGGIAAATRLRELRPDVDVVLVDRRRDFVMGLRKTWEAVGIAPMAEGARPLAGLRDRGIDVRQAPIEVIDPANRRARVEGAWIEADALVVALGAELAPGAVPGLVEHGIDAWDRAGAPRVAAALESLVGRTRGRPAHVAVGIFGTPYACPPGPFELALLARDRLAALGVEARIEVFGPTPIALPAMGPVQSAKLVALLEAAAIPFRAERKAIAVEPGLVRFADAAQDPIAFDVLLAVPPHRVPRLLVEAGLAPEGGWVPVDGRTLETAIPGVSAIGDCTVVKLSTGMPLAKAGMFAEAEGLAVAERLAATVGRPGATATATFDGRTVCFAEVGGGRAVRIEADFFAPKPGARMGAPSRTAMAGKRAFETDRLRAWFGR